MGVESYEEIDLNFEDDSKIHMDSDKVCVL